ncbi:MAG: energy coupling factor transporter S component ThiW [Candidatus Bathyarchaeia archaeon]
MNSSSLRLRKIGLVAVFSALGVVIAPFLWFPFLGTKAYPGQHMINSILGVLLGPLWAAAAAIIIGLIRNALGIGTIYAFPGGIPGGLVVGAVYWALRRLRKGRLPLISALFEPVGTVLIGATLSLFLVAPWIADPRLLSQLEKGPLTALILLWSGWALSSVSGSLIGLIILLALDRIGINREVLFRETLPSEKLESKKRNRLEAR